MQEGHGIVYYLDFHKLYTQPKKADRVSVRLSLDRDKVMTTKLKNQHNACFYCCKDIDMTGHLDHLVPVRYGGTNLLRNLVASCRDCNMTKSTDQIEITNPYTILDYQRKIEAYKKWKRKLNSYKDTPEKYAFYKRHVPRKVQAYYIHRADLFKEI